jgi:hypothetical protein
MTLSIEERLALAKQLHEVTAALKNPRLKPEWWRKLDDQRRAILKQLAGEK